MGVSAGAGADGGTTGVAVWHATGVSAMSHAVSVESRAAVGVAEYFGYLNIMQFPLMAGGGGDYVLVCGAWHQTQVEPASDERNSKTIDLRWANREIQTAR